jgi:hypothetical protein
MNSALDSFYRDAAQLELTEAEARAITRCVNRHTTAHRRSPRRVAAVGVAVALMAVVAAPAWAALGDALGGLGTFFDGGQPPGAQISQSDYPSWLRGNGGLPETASVLATRNGASLYAYRDASGDICFGYGGHVSDCDGDAAWWRARFGSHQAVVLSTNPTSAGAVALYGIATRAAARVALRSADSLLATAPVTNGGFVVSVPAGSAPTTLVITDAGGATLDSLDVSTNQWTFCSDEQGCP